MHPIQVRNVRRALGALIVVIVAAVGINYLATWRRRMHAIERTARILGPELVRSAEGLEYSEHQNGALRFKIRARRLVETRAGVNHLEGIEAFDFNPDGTIRNQIRSRLAEYDRDRRRAFFSGAVRITMSGDVELRTESLRYDLASSIGTTDDVVAMTSPEAHGTARGVRYDHQGQRLDFSSQVDFTLRRARGKTGEQTVRAVAGSGSYTRAPSALRFERGARFESPSGQLSAAEIAAAFDGDSKRVSSLVATGGAVYTSGEGVDARRLEGDEMRFGIEPSSGALQSIDVLRRASFSAQSGDGVDRLSGNAIHLDLDPEGALPRAVSSSSAVEFRRTSPKQETVLAGERFQASFRSGTSQLEGVTVRDRARLRTVARAAEALAEELEAAEIRMRFRTEGGRTVPAALEAERTVRWSTAPRQGPGARAEAGRELRAAALELAYAAAGDALESGSASGNVALESVPVPGAQRAALRRLEASRVRFRFHPGENRLKEFDADGNVSATAGRGEGGPSRDFRTSSHRLHATLAKADGIVESVEQWGDVRYQDEARSARAGRSTYAAELERMVLEESPWITDANGSTTGERIEYDRKREVLRVSKKVRTVLRPREGEGTVLAPSKEKARQAPSVVTADRMEHAAASGEARYEGNVRLLSESGQLEAADLRISEAGERVEASGTIRHTMQRAPQAAPAPGPATASAAPARQPGRPEAARIEIRAERMVYLESERAAHYTGGTVLVSDDVRMESESLDVVMDAAGREIERAAARGKIHIRQGGREARGDMADYYLRPGKVVVTGRRAEISDPQRGRSSARRLTFFTSDDTILLENQ